MNLATIIGFVFGIALISWASYDAAATAGIPLMKLWSFVSLLIVVGGALAATAIAFKLSEVLSIFKNIKRLISDNPYSLSDIVKDFISLAESHKKGELQKTLESPPESMAFRLKTSQIGCEYVAGGYKKDVIVDILENMEENRAIREERQAKVMKTMGEYTPAFGMIGTLIGLVLMLAGMGVESTDGSDPTAKLGASMAVALITTLYGSIFANFIFLPFAAKLEGISENKEVESALILEGVKLLYDKTHPILVRDKLNAFLEGKDRILDEE
tara:strand:- start:1380 stop:2192 length:813 start_codon:yes stop_codon:yes gene_type:complete